MDQIEGICSDYVQVKGEQTIVLKMKGMEREKDARIVLTNTVCVYSTIELVFFLTNDRFLFFAG